MGIMDGTLDVKEVTVVCKLCVKLTGIVLVCEQTEGDGSWRYRWLQGTETTLGRATKFLASKQAHLARRCVALTANSRCGIEL